MDQCRKEYAEICEVRVCLDAPVPREPSVYERIRFGLLASAWVPRPVGMLLWSALHVLLIVGGPVGMVVEFVITFVVHYVLLFGTMVLLFSLWLGLCNLVALAIDSLVLLGRSGRFCWSFVCKRLRFRQTSVASHEAVVEWLGGAWWTPQLWEQVQLFWETVTRIFWEFVPIVVPCASDNSYMDQKVRTWALWWEEVVHVHDAIAISHVNVRG